MHNLTSELLFLSGGVNVDFDLTFLAHFVLFAAFVVLMKPIILDPLLRLFEERERRTAGAIDRARKMDEKAIGLRRTFEERLDEVRRDAAGDRERERARLSGLQSELLLSARHAASERLEEGTRKLQAEVDDVRHALQRGEQAIAEDIAKRILGREVKP